MYPVPYLPKLKTVDTFSSYSKKINNGNSQHFLVQEKRLHKNNMSNNAGNNANDK